MEHAIKMQESRNDVEKFEGAVVALAYLYQLEHKKEKLILLVAAPWVFELTNDKLYSNRITSISSQRILYFIPRHHFHAASPPGSF